MNTLGKPNFFDIDKYLDCVEAMITCDEVERAFLLLDNMPAWYRDHVPERAKEIRLELHKAFFTPFDYAKADREALAHGPPNYWPNRARILAEEIKSMNAQEIIPHIMEIGPGSFWLREGLLQRALEFTYEYQSLGDQKIPESPVNESSPRILVAFELIEHLSNEMELYQAYLKFEKRAQYIFLSTPLYTYAGGMRHWRKQALGHLRAYTPNEFALAAQRIFPDHLFPKVFCLEDGTMIVRGERA